MLEAISIFFTFLSIMVLAYMALVGVFYFSIFLISARQLRREYELNQKEAYEEIIQSVDAKPVSIIVPAYNEEKGIYASVRSLLSMNYPEYEIIVVNDGSKDLTLTTMIEKFKMKKINKVVRQRLKTKGIRGIYRSDVYHQLYLVDKENGGKADALNAGINMSHYPYICSLDGDSVLEKDAFLKVMKPIIHSNGQIIAAGGSIRIANGCRIERGEIMEVKLVKQPLVVMQVIEYLRAFLMGRIGLSRLNILLIVSGAFGVFHKEWVIKAGGYLTNTVGEDMELVVRLHRLIKEGGGKERIVYVPDPVCWTEAPDTISILHKQRRRWHQGLFESLWRHKKMLFHRKYGTVGFISMPYFIFIELLGPFIELFGYLVIIFGITFSFLNTQLALLVFMMAILYGSILSMSSVLLEEWSLRKYPNPFDIARLFIFAITESFWYRPLTVLWRVEGFLHVLLKKKEWGEMSRKGVSN